MNHRIFCGFFWFLERAVLNTKTLANEDVNNGILRRAWARNEEALFAIKRAMLENPNLKVTLPNFAKKELIDEVIF